MANEHVQSINVRQGDAHPQRWGTPRLLLRKGNPDATQCW